MENLAFLISLGHPSYNNGAIHISLAKCFGPASYIKKECKDCMISGF